jgi:protein SCO1/2
VKQHRTPGLIALAGFLAITVAACGGSKELSGFVREPLPEVADQSLPEATASDEPFEFVAEDDGLLLVYFGYTYCPDVCPTTMSDMRSAVADLGSDAERVDVAMATVDPGRDDPEVISNYVHAFFENGHALRTDDDDQLSVVADEFGAVYSVTETEDGTIEVIHTGHTYVVDDRGLIRVTWPFGTTSEDMTSDMSILLDESA